jgi:hypothetical protein
MLFPLFIFSLLDASANLLYSNSLIFVMFVSTLSSKETPSAEILDRILEPEKDKNYLD